jgi:hypothetical protein
MTPITWKNVAAPNLAPITKEYGDAYTDLGDSVAGIGSAFEGYTTKIQEDINDKISSDIGSQLASATNQDELTQAVNSFRESGFDGNPDVINAAINNASQNIAKRGNDIFNRNMQTSEFNNTVAQQGKENKIAERQTIINEYDHNKEKTKDGLTTLTQQLLSASINPDTNVLDTGAYLQSLFANKIPLEIGQNALTQFKGGLTEITKNENAKLEKDKYNLEQQRNLVKINLSQSLKNAQGTEFSEVDRNAMASVLNDRLDTLGFWNDDPDVSLGQAELLLSNGYTLTDLQGQNEESVRRLLALAGSRNREKQGKYELVIKDAIKNFDTQSK